MKSAAHSQKESEMIANILAGDWQLYHELIRPYERIVYLVTSSCLRTEKEAEVVAQETFIRAFHDLRTLPSDFNFGMWLIRIARNEVRKKALRLENKEVVPADESQDDEAAVSPAVLRDSSEVPSDAVTREEARHLLRNVVRRLPIVCQEVFFLCDVEALDRREVAHMLDVDALSVRTSLHQARMMLQRVPPPKLNITNNELVHSEEK